MSENTFKQKNKYYFDNFVSKGPVRILIGLGVVSLLLVFLIAAISWLLGMAPGKNIFELIWMSLMATFQSNSVPFESGEGMGVSINYIIPMILVTLLGFFVVSIVIGAISNGIQNKIEQMRKGRTLVIEKNHTIILGWSEQIFTIISEIILTAADNRKKYCVVIMGNKDKVEMEEAIKDKVGSTGRVKVVCRQGSPNEITDLKIVNLNTSKSIIIISPDDCADPDSSIIKTILAITKSPDRRQEPFNIIAQIRDPQKAVVAKIVGKDEVEIVLVGELISKIMAQTCRQYGLSIVYTELLDFGGVEIYFKDEPSLKGLTFAETLFKYEDSIVIGLFNEKNNTTILNPPMDTVIKEDDQMIIISESILTVIPSGKKESEYQIDHTVILDKKNAPLPPEKTLILGWNWITTKIIKELGNYLPENSSLTVIAEQSGGAEMISVECEKTFQNIRIEFRNKNITDRKVLDELIAENYDHVIILCYDKLPPQEADAKTLVTLLHLRDIKEITGKNFSIVSEMLDIRNRNLAEAAKVNDFVVSDKLISLILTQLSENKNLNAVFDSLFNPEGSEIYLKPASDFVKLNTEVNFYTVTQSAASRGEIAIGYKIEALSDELSEDNPEKGRGVIIDPPKSNTVTFTEQDRIIVLAEHQVC